MQDKNKYRLLKKQNVFYFRKEKKKCVKKDVKIGEKTEKKREVKVRLH